MRVFRIEREKYLKTTLTGAGAASRWDCRWNSEGTRMVYTSQSRALATLEVAVHLDLNEDLPTDRYYVELDIPDDLLMLEVAPEDLPTGWNAHPPALETQFIGDDFVASESAVMLKVPSCLVPQEFNYLINPLHPEAKKIKVVSTQSMVFDARLGSK